MQDLQKRLLEHYAGVPFSTDVLAGELSSFAARRNKMAALVAEGSLIRIINGVFAVSPALSKIGVDRGVVANFLYGPSCVSFETVLAHDGLIPERVVEVRSAVLHRGKTFETPLGRFRYTTVPRTIFSVGVRMQETARGSYLIASPTRALCDLLMSRAGLRIASPRALRSYLEKDLRVDLQAFKPEREVLRAFVAAGHKPLLFQSLERMFGHDAL